MAPILKVGSPTSFQIDPTFTDKYGKKKLDVRATVEKGVERAYKQLEQVRTSLLLGA
jgi:hypothetical protein